MVLAIDKSTTKNTEYKHIKLKNDYKAEELQAGIERSTIENLSMTEIVSILDNHPSTKELAVNLTSLVESVKSALDPSNIKDYNKGELEKLSDAVTNLQKRTQAILSNATADNQISKSIIQILIESLVESQTISTVASTTADFIVSVTTQQLQRALVLLDALADLTAKMQQLYTQAMQKRNANNSNTKDMAADFNFGNVCDDQKDNGVDITRGGDPIFPMTVECERDEYNWLGERTGTTIEEHKFNNIDDYNKWHESHCDGQKFSDGWGSHHYYTETYKTYAGYTPKVNTIYLPDLPSEFKSFYVQPQVNGKYGITEDVLKNIVSNVMTEVAAYLTNGDTPDDTTNNTGGVAVDALLDLTTANSMAQTTTSKVTLVNNQLNKAQQDAQNIVNNVNTAIQSTTSLITSYFNKLS